MHKLVIACFAAVSAMSAAAAQQAVSPQMFDPAKPQEVGPVWTYHDEKRPFIIMALPAGRSETRTFTIRNTGPATTGPMRFWIDGEGGTEPSRIVKIDPASECVTRGAEPNETCSVNLTVAAVTDGQFMVHVRFLPGIRNGPPGVTLRTILPINGYGSGFGTKLPIGILGNGSGCPGVGSYAEIALSGFSARGGYAQKEPEGSGFILSTAECRNIEFAKGRMDNEQTRACERPIMKQYRAPLIMGPWTLVSQRERGFRLTLLCENDILTFAIAQ